MNLSFVIHADDPMLAGHFPAMPIVPGVVLLDRAIALIEAHQAVTISGVSNAKFLHPVLPDQIVEIGVSPTVAGRRLDIEASVDRVAVMRATATLAAE